MGRKRAKEAIQRHAQKRMAKTPCDLRSGRNPKRNTCAGGCGAVHQNVDLPWLRRGKKIQTSGSWDSASLRGKQKNGRRVKESKEITVKLREQVLRRVVEKWG